MYIHFFSMQVFSNLKVFYVNYFSMNKGDFREQEFFSAKSLMTEIKVRPRSRNAEGNCVMLELFLEQQRPKGH